MLRKRFEGRAAAKTWGGFGAGDLSKLGRRHTDKGTVSGAYRKDSSNVTCSLDLVL